MSPGTSIRCISLRVVAVAVATALVLALVPPGGLHAAPSNSTTGAPTVDADVPLMTASLEASMPAVPTDGTLDYTTVIRCNAVPSYLQARLSVYRPGGRLVYRKTLLAPAGTATEIPLRFERALGDLGVAPGAHRVELEVRAEIDGRLATQNRSSSLLVYGNDIRRVPTALVVSICADPFTDPSGTTLIDPATSQKARADAEEVARFVLNEPDARLSVSIPPLLLQEWRRVSLGYTMTTGAGTVAVPAEDPVPRAYATTLEVIAAAASTGRLELLSAGYSDPDMLRLSESSLVADVRNQYSFGRSIAAASLAASSSAGTAPAGGRLGDSAIVPIEESGMGFAVLGQTAIESGLATTPAGAYKLRGHELVAVISDDTASGALEEADSAEMTRGTYDRAMSSSTAPFIVSVRLDDDTPAASKVVEAALVSFNQPWVRPVLVSTAARFVSSRKVRVAQADAPRKQTQDYWAGVAGTSARVGALIAASGELDADVSHALASLLIAESACWSTDLGDGSVNRAQGFIDDAEKIANGILGGVSVRGAAVTLAGAKGNVPITVTNRTERTLRVAVRAVPGSGLRVHGRDTVPLMLRPQENYVQIPVDLGSALTGRLKVEVLAGSVVIGTTEVDVKASYLDRLALISIIAVLLGIGLALIVRRVRAADRTADADEGPERYTGSNTDLDSRGDAE